MKGAVMEEKKKEIIEQMCDQIVEQQRDTYQGKLEPFEVYAKRMKAKLIAECQSHMEHIKHGYEAIINKINSENKSSK
jgi:hypothetical protein